MEKWPPAIPGRANKGRKADRTPFFFAILRMAPGVFYGPASGRLDVWRSGVVGRAGEALTGPLDGPREALRGRLRGRGRGRRSGRTSRSPAGRRGPSAVGPGEGLAPGFDGRAGGRGGRGGRAGRGEAAAGEGLPRGRTSRSPCSVGGPVSVERGTRGTDRTAQVTAGFSVPRSRAGPWNVERRNVEQGRRRPIHPASGPARGGRAGRRPGRRVDVQAPGRPVIRRSSGPGRGPRRRPRGNHRGDHRENLRGPREMVAPSIPGPRRQNGSGTGPARTGAGPRADLAGVDWTQRTPERRG
ncbi:hypothetical protein ACRB68_80270 [Actinomadura sp. RB68]|uniref:Uncharacterized protein n=1 Tax=Actinomadura macrotermitis TaxID=2585200 RepID=A0A7K0C8W7_9ACTN|nr:hypothetical protein [Actinomadura macrotermitis]